MQIKTFLRTLIKTFTTPEYYLEIIKKPISFSFIFFLLSFFIFGIISAIKFNYFILPKLENHLITTQEEIIQHYPSELIINWDGDKLSINQDEDLDIDYPSFVNKEILTLAPQLASISKKELAETDIENLDQNFLLIFSSDYLFLNQDNKWQSIELKTLPLFQEKFQIRQDNLPEILSQIQSSLEKIFSMLKKFSYLLIPSILIISRIWIIVLDCFFIFIFGKIVGLKLAYKKIFQWGLHIVVIAEFINQVSKVIYKNLTLPMFSLAFWGIFLYLFFNLRKKLSSKLTVE
ncbi:MAG: DUF1189 family protein [Candidatus Woesebacteria bacterium]